MTDLEKRARDCANGIGSPKTNSGDFGLFDDLADRIKELEAENARLRAEVDELHKENDLLQQELNEALK